MAMFIKIAMKWICKLVIRFFTVEIQNLELYPNGRLFFLQRNREF